MKLSTKKILFLLIGWLIAANVLVILAQLADIWLVKGLLFISISLLPGAALFRALQVKPASFLEGLVYSFGLSVLIAMICGLIANQLLPGLGISRPLELPGILGAWNLITAICIVVAARVNHQPLTLKKISQPKWPKTTWILIVTSALLPIVAAFGAFRLNNGGDALFAMAALCFAAVIMGYTFFFRNRLHDNTIAWSIFSLGLSILLMTALRSWDISGHDMAREFRVYTLVHVNGQWDIGAYRDAYNACLSITILPEMYAKLLHVSGLVSFKLLLQIIFAVCPVVIYLSLRRYASKLGALIGCGLFICYPTFINDSAMLTRQGVAYLFFALAFLAATGVRRKRMPKALFLLCGLGVILSHYSTSYMFIAIFAIALCAKIITGRLRGDKLRLYGNTLTILRPAIFIILTLGTFLWYAQVTTTSGGLVTTLIRSASNIPNLLSDDNKSSDTSAALLLASRKSQIDIYQAYLARPERSDNFVDAARYLPQITSDDIPLTALGEQARKLGLEPSVTTTLRQQFAKILQLLTVISVFYALFVFIRRKRTALPLDLVCFSLAGIVLLAFMVALPNLSISYGVLRTFQQSLIFLVIPLIILLLRLGRILRPRIRAALATGSMLALFLLFTGFFAQLLGGVGANLTLNNHGLYYGLYYTTKADRQAYTWIAAHIPKTSDVRAASHAKAIMHDPTYPFEKTGILPTQRPPGSYAYLNQAQLVSHSFYVSYEGSPLITTFPLNYYNEHADQLYSTTTTGVYR